MLGVVGRRAGLAKPIAGSAANSPGSFNPGAVNSGGNPSAGRPPAAGAGWKVPYPALRYVLALTDVAFIVAASLCGSRAYQLMVQGNYDRPELALGAGLVAALLYVLIGQSGGFYDLRAVFKGRRDARQILLQWALVSLLLTCLAFLMKLGAGYSRGSMLCFATLALAMLLYSRGLAKRWVRAAVADGRVGGRPVVLLGSRDELAAISAGGLLQRHGLRELDRVAFAADQQRNLALGEMEQASVERAVTLAREHGADEIVLALPWTDTRKIELVRDQLRASPLPVELLPDRRVRSLTDNPSFTINRSLSIEVQRGPLTRLEQFAKRSVDITGATLGLVALLPLMILSAIAIKLESEGPVLFRQRRNGFNSKPFMIYKFRTMSVMEDGGDLRQATRGDPRVTRIGGFLRKTSIDELPQLLNVLRGEMSLVGPRPHALAHDGYYGNLIADYACRHHVKPGITGWAQIHGCRGGTANVAQMKQRLDFDLWYINRWTLALDLVILLRTVVEVMRPRNAY
jgi:undecaprenyl-phosphate galactose phosphotransferase/putative colanic acid biosynthesis UDP-glucose lipid carrier transferase